MRMENTVALVTCAAQGIGRAIAVRLAQEGAKIVVEDRLDSDLAEQTLAEVRAAGSDGCVIAGDVGRLTDVAQVVEQGVAKMGCIDVLVNNAGVEHNASPAWSHAAAMRLAVPQRCGAWFARRDSTQSLPRLPCAQYAIFSVMPGVRR